MKIYKNFYFWYATIFLISIGVSHIIQSINYDYCNKNHFLESILNVSGWSTVYLAIGFLPIGISQVFYSIYLYVKNRSKYWLIYFIPLTLFVIIASYYRLIAHSIIDELSFLGKESYHQLEAIMIGIATFCYIAHIILSVKFNTKTNSNEIN